MSLLSCAVDSPKSCHFLVDSSRVYTIATNQRPGVINSMEDVPLGFFFFKSSSIVWAFSKNPNSPSALPFRNMAL